MVHPGPNRDKTRQTTVHSHTLSLGQFRIEHVLFWLVEGCRGNWTESLHAQGEHAKLTQNDCSQDSNQEPSRCEATVNPHHSIMQPKKNPKLNR